MRFISSLGQQLLGLCHLIHLVQNRLCFSKTFNQYTFSLTNLILAKNLVGKQFGKGFYESKDPDFENFKEMKIKYLLNDGADLVGIKSRTVNAISTQYQNAFRVISGDFVTIEDGTGIVHTSPTLRDAK
jgi:isoleucyl-tRNA synthetase